MLVLSRKAGECVHIGATVVVTVVGIHNGRVRLAFDAPPEVPIDRAEVRQRWPRSIPEDQQDPVLIPLMSPTAGQAVSANP